MRTTKGAARTRAKKRLFHAAKGFWGGRRKLLRTAKENLLRAGRYAWRDRRARKRDFRRLWITRISAACRLNGFRYNRLIEGLTKAGVGVDRKMLAEMAVHDAEAFGQMVNIARQHATLPAAA